MAWTAEPPSATAPQQSPESGNGLTDVLSRTQVALDAEAIRALVAGVASAPDGIDPDAWMHLVSPQPTSELKERLRELLADCRRCCNNRNSPGGRGEDAGQRLDALRAEVRRRRLAGFIVPHADEHQNEQLAPGSARLAWLTGFTGSAGIAVVLRDRAVLFVDGRYTVQAAVETDSERFEIRHLIDEPPAGWIAEHLPRRGRLGFDPWLHTAAEVRRYRAACRKAEGRLVAVDDNPIDRLWRDRPPPPIAPIVPHDAAFAGQESCEKRQLIADALANEKHDAAVLTAPESIAWLLNVRGGDMPYTPAPLAFAVVYADGRVDLFVDGRKFMAGLDAHLGDDVTVRPPEALGMVLDRLGAEKKRVRIDDDRTPFAIRERLRRAGAELAAGQDPCALPKAMKNRCELDGMRAAHHRDGAALTRFLAWLDRATAAAGVTEVAAAERLEVFRRDNDWFRGNSFPTISAAGPHGAIVHYRATPETDRRLDEGTLYLVDSGGQYPDGTTDVTRTIAVGAPDDEMRDRFTRVLKGHIAIATARFPVGTTGPQLDVLARQALWRAGLDYDHGTGHGVGAYLNVHEGPHRISKIANKTALKPGMIVSNEPGYYKIDAYGIRIENLVTVTSVAVPEDAERRFLGFETLTLAPIDLRLVNESMLSREEIAWLDAYHERVRTTLEPLVDPETAAWLLAATRPIASISPR